MRPNLFMKYALIRSWALGLSSGDRLPRAFHNSRGTLGLPPVNCHRIDRIIELTATVTAHAISTSSDREDAAKIAVMTPKQEIEQRCDLHLFTPPRRALVFATQGQCTSDTEMISAKLLSSLRISG